MDAQSWNFPKGGTLIFFFSVCQYILLSARPGPSEAFNLWLYRCVATKSVRPMAGWGPGGGV